MEECLKNCTDCHATCVDMVQYCLEKGGNHVNKAHMSLLIDCIEICDISKNFLLRNSARHPLLCKACFQICKDCADSCYEMAENDEKMLKCAEMCIKCAESCKKMSG